MLGYRCCDAKTGELVFDEITVGNLQIPRQALGSATCTEGFDTVDGVLGWVSYARSDCADSRSNFQFLQFRTGWSHERHEHL